MTYVKQMRLAAGSVGPNRPQFFKSGSVFGWILGTMIAFAPVDVGTGFAQPTAPTPGSPEVKKSSFATGGIRVTIGSVAMNSMGDAITVSTVISNESQNDVLASIIGPVEAVNNAGGVFRARQLSAFSQCDAGGTLSGDRDRLIKACVTQPGETSYQTYTTIDKGNSVVVPINFFAFSSGQKKGNQFSFSMSMAIVQSAEQKPESLDSKARYPYRARVITVGVPFVPLSDADRD